MAIVLPVIPLSFRQFILMKQNLSGRSMHCSAIYKSKQRNNKIPANPLDIQHLVVLTLSAYGK